jgi:hypothetical protein
MGQVDTPRQVTWSVFACCCCCCYCCWNIQEIRKAFVDPCRMPRLRLAFKRLTDSRAACAISRFFALCYVCQHVDRFCSVFVGKLLLPYMLHADILFSDWFPQETGGRGSHHMLVALGERLPVCGSWPTGNPDNHVTIPPFKSWYVLIIPVPLSSFCMIYPRKSNIPWMSKEYPMGTCTMCHVPLPQESEYYGSVPALELQRPLETATRVPRGRQRRG